MAKKLTIKASEFRAKCLKLMDLVDSKRIEIEITKRGRPIAKLVPVEKSSKFFGCLKGSITYCGSVIDPIAVDWEANI